MCKQCDGRLKARRSKLNGGFSSVCRSLAEGDHTALPGAMDIAMGEVIERQRLEPASDLSGAMAAISSTITDGSRRRSSTCGAASYGCRLAQEPPQASTRDHVGSAALSR